MKPLLLILVLYLSWASCVEISAGDFQQQSKRVKPERVHIFNSRRYIKPGVPDDRVVKLKPKKKAVGLEAYTAYPPVGANVGLDVPDSPYFPHDPAFDQKSRVKKVLPNYDTLLRRKRSPDAALVNPEGKDVAKDAKKAKVGKPQTARKGKKNKKKNKKNKRGKKGRGKSGKRGRSGKRSGKSNRNKKGSKTGNRTAAKRGTSLHKGPASPIAKGRDGRRLIASRDAVIEDYPYVVSIQKSGKHWCTGSLLNPRVIITTANCLWKSPTTSRLQVRAGSRYVDRGGQTAGIAQVMRHPAWGIRKEPDHDVALALLDTKIRFSDSVHGVDLPNRYMVPAFEDAWVASWGAIRRDGIFEPSALTLQAYYARLLPRPKCNNITMRFGVRVSENFICLAQTGKQAPCTRDTGAPAVSDGVLWGMASWGIRKLCGTERFPAVFSYVGSDSNMNFIINATRYLMVDERFEPFLGRLPIRAAPSVAPQPDAEPFYHSS